MGAASGFHHADVATTAIAGDAAGRLAAARCGLLACVLVGVPEHAAATITIAAAPVRVSRHLIAPPGRLVAGMLSPCEAASLSSA